MTKMSIGVFAVAICAAVSVQAETWQVFSHDAKPTKDGAEQGDAEMSPAAQLAYAVTNAASGSEIHLQQGRYDFSNMEPVGASPDKSAYLCIPSGRRLHFYGEGETHWSEKTREEETILSGSVGAPLVYGVNGSSRCSKFYGISFENSTNTYSDAGGAIAMTANERYADTPPSLVSNCVFRNCRASGKGGGTSCISAFDCFYTNCTAAGNGGGAYGGDHVISGGALHSTNTFQNCTFIGCSGSAGGGLFCNSGADCEAVSGCTFIDCAATGSGCHGGGAYFGSYVKGLSDCMFENCTSKGGGGGLWLVGGADYLRGCRFVGNTSTSSSGGGGFRSEGAMPLELTNCAFTNNTSTSGYGGNASAKTFGAVTNCVFKGGRASKGAGVNAGVASAASREPANGDFVRCVFEDNRNNDRSNDGSHVNNALSLADCRFTGWGDVWARTVDRCSFVACEYYPNDGSYNDGLIRLTDGVTTPENVGRVRNCLFARCLASVLVENESYYNAEIENCTFADNILTNAVHHDGFVLYAWRATPPGKSGTHPATNLVSNCIFWNNLAYKYSNQTCERADPKFYRTTNTGVGKGAANIVKNCIYGVKGDSEDPQRATNFNPVDDPKFVKDNAVLKAHHPEYPDYMICRDSPAVDTGAELDWHATGKDLLGNDRVFGAAVDLGAYECNLTQVAYADGKDYDSLDKALEDVGATKRIGLYDDVRLDNWDQITPERYFVDTNGHTVTAPAGADVQVVNGTLSVGVSAIYEPAGAFNVMPGDIAGLTNALVNATKADVIVLSPGTYDLSSLTEQRVPADTASSLVLGTAYSADKNGCSSIVWRNERQIRGACKVHWSEKTAAQETLIRNNGSMRIFYGYTGGGRASKFANLSFEGGDAQGLNGGAILFAGSEYGGYVTNCVFRNCKGNSGGATYDVSAYDCFYTNNLATKCGGAAFGCETVNGSNVKTNDFVDCIFVGNKATGAGSGAGGGAIYCEKQNLIVGCAFTNNEATAGAGGAVRVEAVGVSAVVSNCVFSGNSANAAEMTGGGASGCGDVYDSQFYDNSSHGSGGGVYNSIYSVCNCVFSNNVSRSWGGGWRGDGRCVGCTFIGNRQAARGGALYCNGPVAAVTNCTFVGNNCEDATSKSGTTYGGAVYASNRLDMENCFFDGNEAKLGANGCAGTGGSVWCSTAGEIANCTFKNGKASRETGGLCIDTLSGTIRDCTFDSNTNSPSGSYPGAHLRGAQNVVGCAFTGYGDVCAKSYDRCTFAECVFPYLLGNDCAFLSFRHEYGEGTVRNCLFASNSVNHIMASEGVVTRFENCTFSDNVIPNKGCLFWAFRYGGGSGDRTGIPSTNYIANCIFANGTKLDSTGAAQPGDISFYSTGTGVPSGSVLQAVSNSIYGVRGKDYNGETYNPKIEVNFLGGKDPKFAKDDPELAGRYPGYMPKRGSAARRLGAWASWMAGAKDLAGTDMPAAVTVDAGCYQCTLPAIGMLLLIR